ncbi:hypothetical protein SAMN04489760_14613 [Syntrophus gentianae]|uniref:Uncharacterized protein n=1 Tax=Syntrophus gentianae TaxID=43775 RepID=A0A1H8B480_9BACT|nr:hypothetical protein [Syntrophus gentianae]SEM77725.1 hypothetical protein SAMN04489760_14613 [Syntrophus gentianae]
MAEVWNDERLKEFVQKTLGCVCPEEVFEKIEVGRHLVEGYSGELTRIVVGDKLLIYVARPDPGNNFADRADLVGLAGKTDRDANKYNRFRLVVAFSEGFTQKDHVSERFFKTFVTDEKMHLHFVSEKLL